MIDNAFINLENLKKNNYPGRGIILGLSGDGNFAVQVYWLSGRSENSRNRVFIKKGDTIKTKAFDESKLSDPSLIIYNAMKVVDQKHIVSNGDQTDTIASAIEKNTDIKGAIKTRTYEPDEPNYTARISGITTFEKGEFVNFFSIIYRGDDGSPVYFFDKKIPQNGIGLCFHTYEGDGNPLPSFKRAPYLLKLAGNIDEIADNYWKILNEENKVSLVVKTIDKNGKTDYRIKNKLT